MQARANLTKRASIYVYYDDCLIDVYSLYPKHSRLGSAWRTIIYIMPYENHLLATISTIHRYLYTAHNIPIKNPTKILPSLTTSEPTSQVLSENQKCRATFFVSLAKWPIYSLEETSD